MALHSAAVTSVTTTVPVASRGPPLSFKNCPFPNGDAKYLKKLAQEGRGITMVKESLVCLLHSCISENREFYYTSLKKEERRVEDWGEERRASEVEIEPAMASSRLGFDEIGDPPWLIQDWDLRK
ncbi:hypothetical protein FCM35_KLT15010 [Carex littledalei]|uniref:Uncharacterized protein n=1 Tax=Carex littledalei TaxID=544730 RepID=A0A833UZ95_9POAL|nr:hypothetical protein FCM35_KLT15010 [Carex littledalei]